MCADAVNSQGILALVDDLGSVLKSLSVFACPAIAHSSLLKLIVSCKSLESVNLGCRFDQEKQNIINKFSKDQMKLMALKWSSLKFLDLSFRCPIYLKEEKPFRISEILNSFPNLQELKLCGWSGFSDSLEIERNPFLKEIDISWASDLNHSFIESLCKACINIKKMIARKCDGISDYALKQISTYCKYITSLNLSACTYITVEGFSYFHRMRSLEELVLDFLPIEDNTCGLLVSIPKLKFLSLANCSRITNQTLNILHHSVFQISNLNLSKCTLLHFSGIEFLLNSDSAKYISTLRLSGVKGLIAESIKSLELLENLKALDISECDLRADVFKLLKLTAWSLNLSHLNISSNYLVNFETCDAVAAIFCNLNELVSSWNPKVCNQSVEALGRLKKLVLLDLTGCSSFTKFNALKSYLKKNIHFKRLILRSFVDVAVKNEISDFAKQIPGIYIEF
jgi:hypothetical protein